MPQIKIYDTIKVHYTGKLDDGQVFDSLVNRKPIQFKVGEGKIITGFEQAVIGMKLNEPKTIKVPSVEAYGPNREELIQETYLPKDLEPKVGNGACVKAS